MLSAARLSGLCHNHQQFLANGSRQVDITHLDAPAPPRYIIGKQCEQYVAEFLYLFIGIVIGTAPTETVEFLIIVIYNLRAYCCQKAVTLTCHMHAATILAVGLILLGRCC